MKGKRLIGRLRGRPRAVGDRRCDGGRHRSVLVPPDDTERAVASALKNKHPKNVIFLLGDGMGTQEITAARYYQGVHNPLNVDRMPFTGFDTTWSVKPAAAAPTCPTTTPTRPPPGAPGRPARKRSTSGSRRARAARSTCPART